MTSLQLDAALHCISHNIPFALFALPSEEDFRFFANPSFPAGGGECFIVSPWMGRFGERLKIFAELSAEKALSCERFFPEVEESEKESTRKEDYTAKVGKLIEELKITHGKAVISRIITGDCSSLDIGEFIKRRFTRYPNTFRFLFFTPATGLWLGTSPEELLSYDSASQRFSIMSLAGTRKSDETADWDAKNIVEQSVVTRFIASVLDENGVKFIHKICGDVEFYPVKHLCHRFFGLMPEEKKASLLDSLSPTPALGGFPREEALKQIAGVEEFQRECYGGYIGLESNEKNVYFVNLRSIKLGKRRYIIYVGGGITGNSDPEPEFQETMSKSVTMLADLKENSLKS